MYLWYAVVTNSIIQESLSLRVNFLVYVTASLNDHVSHLQSQILLGISL